MVNCPNCGEEAEFTYVSVRLGRLSCQNCGLNQPLGEIKVVGNQPNPNDIIDILGKVAIASLGIIALISFLNALFGEENVEEKRRRKERPWVERHV